MAQKGNKNAKKDKVATASVTVRMDPIIKSSAEEHAKEIGLDLSKYINRLIKSDMNL